MAGAIIAVTGGSAGAETDPGPSAPNPAQRTAALTRPAVVFVEIQWSGYVWDQDGDLLNNGAPFEFSKRCTGFAVNPEGYVITAGHCVDDGMDYGARGTFVLAGAQDWLNHGWIDASQFDQLVAIGRSNWKIEGRTAGSPPDRQVFVQYGVATSGLRNGQALPARVVDAEMANPDSGDVALLKVERENLPSLLLAPASAVDIGTEVSAVGYPGSTDLVTDETLEPTNKDGEVNAKKTHKGVPFYEVSAAISGGMSGGPVVDADARVVGLVSFFPLSENQAFNFIAPSSLISEVLTRNGVKNELGRLDRVYRQGLDRYFEGNYTAAIAQFDEVLAVSPWHQQAQEFKAKAAEQKQLTGDLVSDEKAGGGTAVALLAAAGLVIVVGGLGGIFLLKRRGRSRVATSEPATESLAWMDPPAPAPMADVPPAPAPEPRDAPSRGEPQPSTVADSTDGSALEAAPVRAAVATGSANAVARFCPGCGARREGEAAFCPSCGYRH